MPWRLSSWVLVPHPPFFMGKPGWVRSSAWIWLFSSTQRTTAYSGGCRDRSTTFSSLSWKCGSWLSVKVRTRLQAMGGPDLLHKRRIRPQVPSQGVGRPVSGAGRCRLGRRLQNARGERLAHLGGPPPARRILDEAGQALGRDAMPPKAHGLPTGVQGGGTVLVVVALGRQQGHRGAEHALRRRPPSAGRAPAASVAGVRARSTEGRGDAQGDVLLWRRIHV